MALMCSSRRAANPVTAVLQSRKTCENTASFTPEQYRKGCYDERSKNAEGHYEYFAGEVFAMAGGSPEHTRLSGNVFGALREKLRGTDCEAFTSDLRLKVPTALPYRYPDVSVVCGAQQYEEVQGVKLLLNPVLLVEVLSSTTAENDLGEKFTEYQSIPSFRE